MFRNCNIHQYLLQKTFQTVHCRWERDLRQRTIKGDPKPMGIDVLGLIPLLTSTISNNTENLIHIVFADDY